jgi:hypothetical protein
VQLGLKLDDWAGCRKKRETRLAQSMLGGNILEEMMLDLTRVSWDNRDNVDSNRTSKPFSRVPYNDSCSLQVVQTFSLISRIMLLKRTLMVVTCYLSKAMLHNFSATGLCSFAWRETCWRVSLARFHGIIQS